MSTFAVGNSLTMNTKLTLTIEESVIEKAKAYARKSHRSLSDLIENYLKGLTADEIEPEKGANEESLSPIVKQLKGSFKAPENFDYKKELTERLSKKYIG